MEPSQSWPDSSGNGVLKMSALQVARALPSSSQSLMDGFRMAGFLIAQCGEAFCIVSSLSSPLLSSSYFSLCCTH